MSTALVVFGENPNDTNALRELVLGLCSSLEARNVRVLREPPTLQRTAKPETIRKWVDRAAAALRAARVALGDVVCILAHSDADAPDDGTFEAERTKALRQAGFEQAHAVVPVETIEAWWLLFPDATESIVSSWNGALPRSPRDVDRLSAPKAELVRRTRNKQPRRPYEEADSPTIAKAIVTSGMVRVPSGSSASYERFIKTVDDCCKRLT